MDIAKEPAYENIVIKKGVNIAVTLLTCILSFDYTLRAEVTPNQLYLEHDTYVELEDNLSLFKCYPNDTKLWDKIIKYYHTSISTKRRGVEWWQLQRVSTGGLSANKTTAHPHNEFSAKVFASSSEYRVGASTKWSASLKNGWGVSSTAHLLSGRDSKIEGLFRQEFSTTTTLSGDFGADHHLFLVAKIPYQMRGLRSSATQECYDLTHNNLYNPAWGYYHGELRNSRVVRNFVPSLSACYQRSIASATKASIDIDSEYGTRKISRLGWYDATNPMPNYYNKLPSYYEGSSIYNSVEESWQQNNTQYTQIAWDNLEQINLSSIDGSAHYVVEDRVERVADISARLTFDTQLSNNIKISYGSEVDVSNHRNYKQMRDLLGGEYLLDIDQYAGDFVQTGNELQNNLRDPNRKITTGDRFGYDFTHHRTHVAANAEVEYYTSRGNLQLSTNIGKEFIYRQGHYEKERFPGSGSYGDSQNITLATFSFSASGGYAILPQHSISARIDFNTEAPLSRYLFVNDQNSNRVIDSPTTEKIISASAKYRYIAPRCMVEIEGYALSIYDITEVWQGYDDLSATYCDVVISDIATRSIGVEMSGEFSIGRRWRITSAISCGGFIYNSAPLVMLYDDVDMSLVAESRASTLRGYIVGNAPQVISNLGATYFGRKGIVLGVDLSYLAMRYSAVSIMRRTDRVVNSSTSIETLESILTQQRLPDYFDANISVVKSFGLRNSAKITVSTKIENIIGSGDVISSAREGNRVLGNYTSGLLYSYSPQSSTYTYSEGRTFYLSVKYQF